MTTFIDKAVEEFEKLPQHEEYLVENSDGSFTMNGFHVVDWLRTTLLAHRESVLKEVLESLPEKCMCMTNAIGTCEANYFRSEMETKINNLIEGK
jgi:hypothetical protein